MHTTPLLLIKEQALVAHEAHYAGGIHLFNCLATSLSQHLPVHVFTTARKSLVMHHALMHGLLGQLKTSYQPAEVIHWISDHGIHFHVVVSLDESSSSSCVEHCPAASALACPAATPSILQDSTHGPLATLISTVADTAAKLDFECRYILDVDTLQHATISSQQIAQSDNLLQDVNHERPGPDFESSSAHHEQPFMLALLQQLQQRQQSTPTAHQRPAPQLIALVQNVHHLPFGPCGTAPRNSQVLAAWQQVISILCVSNFVRSYLEQHALPLIGWNLSRVRVFHPAAVGVFGHGPIADLGTATAGQLWVLNVDHTLQQQQQESQQPAEQQQEAATAWRQRPIIGMLKCSREKGSDLLFGLAARLPDLQFLAVTADPDIYQQASAATAEGITNITLVSPGADVSQILQQMSVVIVPSVLQEAFGLVVVDAMLHGLPVIVADAGALPEAAAGAAVAVVPVQLVQFRSAAAASAGDVQAAHSAAITADQPLQAHSSCKAVGDQQEAVYEQLKSVQQWQAGRCHWRDRLFPDYTESDHEPWIAALKHVLSSRDVYMEYSKKGRAVGNKLCAAAGDLLQLLVDWL